MTYQRNVEITATPDVLVVGGGPAGLCAAVAAVLTLAIKGGAVFSPFMWIFLLVSLNLTVGVMLCVFALR